MSVPNDRGKFYHVMLQATHIAGLIQSLMIIRMFCHIFYI